jgi:hypothetical protein
MLISRIMYGWQRRRYICVLVDESSGFCCALTKQLQEVAGAGLQLSLVMVCCCDVLWKLTLKGLVEPQAACQFWGSAFFIQE